MDDLNLLAFEQLRSEPSNVVDKPLMEFATIDYSQKPSRVCRRLKLSKDLLDESNKKREEG